MDIWFGGCSRCAFSVRRGRCAREWAALQQFAMTFVKEILFHGRYFLKFYTRLLGESSCCSTRMWGSRQVRGIECMDEGGGLLKRASRGRGGRIWSYTSVW